MKKYLFNLFVIIAVWSLVATLKIVNPLFLPSPTETFFKGLYELAKKDFYLDLMSSFGRISLGVSLAFLVGLPTGLLLGYYEKVFKCFEYIIDFFRSIPPILAFPLALLIFGTGNSSRIAVIFFGCVSIITLNTALGVVNSQKLRIRVAKVFGARWYQILTKVIIYDAMPQIFVGIRVAISIGIIIGIVTEMLVGARHGLGSRAVNAQIAYDTAGLYFTIITVGVIGFILNKVLALIEHKMVHWKQAN